MQENGDEFRLNPEWESIANEKNVFGMATALYSDLKQHMFSGAFIPQESISQLMLVVQKVLYNDFGWNEGELKALDDKFEELNQYYLDKIEGSHSLPPAALMVAPNSISTEMMPGTTHIHMEIVKNRKNRSKMSFVKDTVIVFFEIAVCCLAIIGLMALIGLI